MEAKECADLAARVDEVVGSFGESPEAKAEAWDQLRAIAVAASLPDGGYPRREYDVRDHWDRFDGREGKWYYYERRFYYDTGRTCVYKTSGWDGWAVVTCV